MTTFVTVGNATQPFKRLVESVVEISAELPQPVVIQHGNTPISNIERCILKPFVGMDEFSYLVNDAELLIMHAGAGSVIHAIQARKTLVVMPRRERYGEHVDDHQLEFSTALAETGKIILAEESNDLPGAVEKALKAKKKFQLVDEDSFLVEQVGAVLQKYAEITQIK